MKHSMLFLLVALLIVISAQGAGVSGAGVEKAIAPLVVASKGALVRKIGARMCTNFCGIFSPQSGDCATLYNKNTDSSESVLPNTALSPGGTFYYSVHLTKINQCLYIKKVDGSEVGARSIRLPYRTMQDVEIVWSVDDAVCILVDKSAHTLDIYRTDTWSCRTVYNGCIDKHIKAMAYDPSTSCMVALFKGAEKAELYYFDLSSADGTVIWGFLGNSENGELHSLEFSPGGHYLLHTIDRPKSRFDAIVHVVMGDAKIRSGFLYSMKGPFDLVTKFHAEQLCFGFCGGYKIVTYTPRYGNNRDAGGLIFFWTPSRTFYKSVDGIGDVAIHKDGYVVFDSMSSRMQHYPFEIPAPKKSAVSDAKEEKK